MNYYPVSEKGLNHYKSNLEKTKLNIKECVTKDKTFEKNTEKLFGILLNAKDKFIFKSNYDEKNSDIFLEEKDECLENIILDDKLPEEYYIIQKASEIFITPTLKKVNLINVSRIYCKDPLEMSFKNDYRSNEVIELKIDKPFSFHYSQSKKK